MKTKRLKKFSAALVLFGLTFLATTTLRAAGEWEILDGFAPLPRGMTQVGDHYVAVPFVDSERQLLAAVFFFATCELDNCELYHRAGYAITDAQGSFIRLHVEPQEEELLALIHGNLARQSNYLH